VRALGSEVRGAPWRATTARGGKSSACFFPWAVPERTRDARIGGMDARGFRSGAARIGWQMRAATPTAACRLEAGVG
jgi:hypothetical protein